MVVDDDDIVVVVVGVGIVVVDVVVVVVVYGLFICLAVFHQSRSTSLAWLA